MHIEKNVCESIIGTLLNIPGKTNDELNAQLDQVEMGLRSELCPRVDLKRTYLPPVCYSLSKNEKKISLSNIVYMKLLERHCSNFWNLVSLKELKLFYLKPHDYQVLIQQLLPVALCSILPKHVRYTISRLCIFFNQFCLKVVDVPKLNEVHNELVVMLCLLEKYFSPSVFDIMLHLTMHLIREVRLCGLVYFRWMYPFERYMKVLKGYVHNHNRPEGSIIEFYLVEEATKFCTKYLSGTHAIGIPKSNKYDNKFGRPITSDRFTNIDLRFRSTSSCVRKYNYCPTVHWVRKTYLYLFIIS